jgi:hypothetical protein
VKLKSEIFPQMFFKSMLLTDVKYVYTYEYDVENENEKELFRHRCIENITKQEYDSVKAPEKELLNHLGYYKMLLE